MKMNCKICDTGFDSNRKKSYCSDRCAGAGSAYHAHKAAAKARGVEWQFSIRTWWKLWEPHWDNRGTGPDKLVVCRRGDAGPYSYKNCRIDTTRNNTLEHREIRARRVNKARSEFVSMNVYIPASRRKEIQSIVRKMEDEEYAKHGLKRIGDTDAFC